MSSILLGPQIFLNRYSYASIISPGLVSWYGAGTGQSAYGNIGYDVAVSNLEKFPADIISVLPANVSIYRPTLVSFESATPGATSSWQDKVARYSLARLLAGGPAGTQQLRIYTGTKPEVSNMTDLSAYDSNLLIAFNIPKYASDGTSGFKIDKYNPTTLQPTYTASSTFDGMSLTLGICPTFTAAVTTTERSATWFWYGNVYGGTSDLADIPFLVGTVGTTAASDLVIPNTAIKPGAYYKSFGFKYTIPSIQTF